MQISSALKNGILVLSLEGRLDSLGALDLGEYLKQHLKETDRTAVFDMEGVPYMSSAGIRVIISAEKTLKGRNGRLHLSGVQPYPLSVLEMTGFSTLLSLHRTCRDAVLAAQATADRAGCTGDAASTVSYHLKGAEFLVTRRGTDKGVLEITGINPCGPGGDRDEGMAIIVSALPGACSMGWGAPGQQTGQSTIPMGDFLSLGPVATWLSPDSHDTVDYLILDKKQASIPVTASFLIAQPGAHQFLVSMQSEESNGITFSDLLDALQEIARRSEPGYEGILSLSFSGESPALHVLDQVKPPEIAANSGSVFLAGCAVVLDPSFRSGHWGDAIQKILVHEKPSHAGNHSRIIGLVFPATSREESEIPSERVSRELLSGTPVVLRHLSADTIIRKATILLAIISEIRQNTGTEIIIDGEVGGWNPDYERIVQNIHHECAEVHLHPLSGGFSGSLVFRDDACDRQGRREMPFVLKLDRWENIRAEIEGYEGHVKRYIQNNATQIIETCRSGDYGGILYTFVGIQGLESRISSLEEYYLTRPTDEVQKVFDTLFRKVLRTWYGQPRLRDLPLYRIYSGVFNYDAVKEWARSRYGISPDEEYLALPYGMGRSYNPLYFMDHVLPGRLSSHWNVYEGSVHGDLNMKNVLMDDEKNMWLIDFAMTGHSHILKDIAKLECVLKFEMIPVVSKDRLLSLASLEQGFLTSARFGDIPKIPEEITDPDVLKAFSVIQQLRKYADTLTLLDEDIRQYYLALLYYTLCVPAYVSVNEYMKEFAWISSSLLCNALK